MTKQAKGEEEEKDQILTFNIPLARWHDEEVENRTQRARVRKKRRTGPHLHYTVGTLQSTNMMKKRRAGHNRQEQERRREGPDAHLHDAIGSLQSVDMTKKRRSVHNRQ